MVNRGLAYWSDAVADRGVIDPAARAVLVGHPAFPDACRFMVARTLAWSQKDSVYARAFADVSRYIFGMLALYLDARGGLTHSAICDLLEGMGIASPRRATAILLRLRMIGYVRPEEQRTDRRVRRYVPTGAMKAAFRGAQRIELEALAHIEPDAAHAAARLDEPDFYAAYVRRLGDGLQAVIRGPARNAVQIFAEHNGGLSILFSIITSAKDGDTYPPRGLLKMSVRELARTHGVSRSHVQRLLMKAEEKGLIERDADAQTGTLTERLREGLIQLHVGQLAGNAACAHAAFAATDAPAQSLSA
jgi:DNA-binding MarR family transcriptional regulator